MNSQEQFWSGEFGNDYISRNGYECLPSKIALMSNIFDKCNKVQSVLEFGPNIGLNLIAIRNLVYDIGITAVEINPEACKHLIALDSSIGSLEVINKSMLDYEPDVKHDFVLCSGVLIHQDPSALPHIYDTVAKSSGKYVCFVEYYNPTPVEVEYHGYSGKLFKRDFAGEFMDRHPEFELVDYGFVYHRANYFGMSDSNWFLMKRK